jgi:endonuclease I
MYDGFNITKVWDDGATWNREHVWPQSRLNSSASNSTSNSASDPHNLRAIKSSTNTSRLNRFFVQGSGLNSTVGSNGYYPGDEHRGDVARILLFMAVRYRGILSLADANDPNVDNLPANTMGSLSVLLGWHQADPVDAFERQRNNVIYNAQGNRNPFIDRPDYFEPVWNQLVSEAQQASGKSAQFNATIITYDILKTTYTPTQTRYTI